MKRSLCFLLLGLLLLAGCEPEEQQTDAKPVIYLYPPTETEVSVRLTLRWTADLHLPGL